MHSEIWCSVLLLLLLNLAVIDGGDGKRNAPEKDDNDTPEKESQRSEIPRSHRSSEAHGRRNRRAERGRYRSVLAVGVGCAVAGGWICLATIVYVVRYIRARRKAASKVTSDNDVL